MPRNAFVPAAFAVNCFSKSPAVRTTIAVSASESERSSTRRAIFEITAGISPPLFISASARRRAASTNCGSFSVTSACSGVFVRSRRTVQASRVGALKTSMFGDGDWRFQKL